MGGRASEALAYARRRGALGVVHVPAEGAEALGQGVQQEGRARRAARDHGQAAPGQGQPLAQRRSLQRRGAPARQQRQVRAAAGVQQPVRGQAGVEQRVRRQPMRARAAAGDQRRGGHPRLAREDAARAGEARPIGEQCCEMRHRARGDEIGTQPVEGDDNEAHAPHCSWIARDGRVPTGIQGGLHSGRLRHDGNPVLEWCVGNVVGRPDRRGNQSSTGQPRSPATHGGIGAAARPAEPRRHGAARGVLARYRSAGFVRGGRDRAGSAAAAAGIAT